MKPIHPILAALCLAQGCQCNETEVNFPNANVPNDAAPSADHGAWLSLGTSPDDRRITASYYDRTLGAAAFAIATPGDDGEVAWSYETVDGYPDSSGLDIADRGTHGSHAVAPDGRVWYAYTDALLGGLYVAERPNGTRWRDPVLVDSAGGKWSAVATDANGAPVVAHIGTDGASVRVSRLSGQDWTTEEVYRSEATTRLDGKTERLFEAEVKYMDLVTDGDTQTLAFFDAAVGALTVLEGADTDYAATIAADGDIGGWPSILSTSDRLLISAQDVANERLVLAERSGGGAFEVTTLDDGALTGADTAIFQDADGEPGVVYFDGHNGDQRVTQRSTLGVWSTERVAGETTAAGFYNEVTMVGGVPWAGCYDYTTRTILLHALRSEPKG
jgi:hypothetical protein